VSKGTSVRLIRNASSVISKLDSVAVERMKRATFIVRNETVKTLTGNRSGELTRVPGKKKMYRPSIPGEPPAQRLGHLRSSVDVEVKGEGRQVVGRVGTDLEYGKRLELGHISGSGGPDQKKRPWLAPSFEKALPSVKSELSRKWF
jgi:hypothetical protein